MLKKKGWGTNVITAITKSLRKLRTIPLNREAARTDHLPSSEILVIVELFPFRRRGRGGEQRKRQ